MTSSQRIYQYTQLESEDELVKLNDKKHKEEQKWPSKGEIVFNNVTMKYREHMEPAIIDLACTIQPGMKVGIVGRTGAGKSSLLQAMFRLSELHEGQVMIDGIDSKEVGLHLLRKSVAYIPQSPFLIQGSIRENLDPFNEYTDDDIYKTLREVNLFDHIEKNF